LFKKLRITSAYHSTHCTGRYQLQERTRSTKSELEGPSQQRPTKDGVHLGGSRSGSSWQTRMASECGPMCPVGYGINLTQGVLSY